MNFESIFEAGSGGYEWTEIHVYKNANGAFAVDMQTGCSCYGYETPTYDELNWFYNVSQIYTEFDRAIGEVNYYFDAAESAEYKSKLRQAVK